MAYKKKSHNFFVFFTKILDFYAVTNSRIRSRDLINYLYRIYALYKTEENSILKKGAKLEPKRVNIGVPRSYLVKHGGNGSFMVGSERVNDFFKDYEIVFGSDFDGIMGLF